jgi:hypothetical protein
LADRLPKSSSIICYIIYQLIIKSKLLNIPLFCCIPICLSSSSNQYKSSEKNLKDKKVEAIDKIMDGFDKKGRLVTI